MNQKFFSLRVLISLHFLGYLKKAKLTILFQLKSPKFFCKDHLVFSLWHVQYSVSNKSQRRSNFYQIVDFLAPKLLWDGTIFGQKQSWLLVCNLDSLHTYKNRSLSCRFALHGQVRALTQLSNYVRSALPKPIIPAKTARNWKVSVTDIPNFYKYSTDQSQNCYKLTCLVIGQIICRISEILLQGQTVILKYV